MLNISEIKCVGCTACASVCPKDIIGMVRDPEGFPYPVVENADLCVECGLCEKVCPVLNVKEEAAFPQTGLIAQIADEEMRRESASGGMFSAIALSVLEEKGVVYGAAYDENFQVRHIGISRREDLWKLRGSKYVQSDLAGVFRQVREHLETGRPVCFSGTPCQIEGLQGYLRKDYENLLLVDVVCHGVPSPLVWEKYLETVEKYAPSRIFFRWKHYGYKYSTMSLFSKDKKEVYYAGVESDKMLRAFFSNNCARSTCYECVFKKRYRIADFTIWDCFQPRFFNESFDDDRGTTAVLAHSEKARKRLAKIIDAGLIRYHFVPAEELVLGNSEMVGSVKAGSCRESFLKDAAVLPGEELFRKYFPDTCKTKLRSFLRLVLLKTGLYRTVKYRMYARRRRKQKARMQS